MTSECSDAIDTVAFVRICCNVLSGVLKSNNSLSYHAFVFCNTSLPVNLKHDLLTVNLVSSSYDVIAEAYILLLSKIEL